MFHPLKLPVQIKTETTETTEPVCPERVRQEGFAVVVSLSLLAFVLLLVIALSTLVQVESSSSQIQRQVLEARQSALLGLSVAIGQLQAYAGADQRVTGTAVLADGSAALGHGEPRQPLAVDARQFGEMPVQRQTPGGSRSAGVGE